MKQALVLIVALLSCSAFAVPKIDNPGEFPEYYCDDLSPEHFVGAPASASGNEASIRACAGRFAMASAAMKYGPDIQFLGLTKAIPGRDEDLPAFVFNVKAAGGKVLPILTQLLEDSTQNAPDGYPAIIMTAATEITVCGKFKDDSDSFQIVDGKFNAYVEGGGSAPVDPNGIQNKIWADKPWGKSYCLTGKVEAYNRGPAIAFEFTSLKSFTSGN